MSGIRVVSDAEPTSPIAEALRAACEGVIADKAMGAVVVYETPAGVRWVPVPNLDALAYGLVSKAWDAMEADG